MHIDSIAQLVDAVRVAGARALAAQRRAGLVDRSLKGDGTVVTQVDKWVEDYLVDQIARGYPDANILAEETPHPYDPALPYTFAVDPIDGTEVYSLGLEGWCVSVGLLDRTLSPVAGILFAPRLGILFLADVGQAVQCFGRALVAPGTFEARSPQSGLMVSSKIHHEIDLSAYPGKARGIGTAALHFCFSLIYPEIVGAIQHSRVFAWDMAGAHAINRAHGLDLEYWSGAPIDYAALVDGHPAPDVVVSGTTQAMSDLRQILKRR